MQKTKTDPISGDKLDFLFLTNDQYPPFRVDVEVLFGQEFARRGHRIDWLMQSETALAKETEARWRGWTVYLGATDNGERFLNRLRKHIRAIRNDLRIFRIARQRQYQFIQVKDRFVGAILGLAAAKLTKTPFFFWISYPFPEASIYSAQDGSARYPLFYRLRGWGFHILLYRIIAPLSDHIFVQSDQMKLDMARQGVDPESMTPVLMGFSPQELPSKKVEPNPYQMVYLGTLLQTRRLEFLVGVLAKVRRRVPQATLLMIGPEELPGDMAILRDAAAELGVTDALTLTGRLERTEAFGLVEESAVCFSPFYPTPILNSTSPTKLVEYFSLQKAVVANDHPEQKKVISESGGGYCVAYDEQAFADAAVELILDPDLANCMGKSGFKYAMETRTYEIIASFVERTYIRLLRKGVH